MEYPEALRRWRQWVDREIGGSAAQRDAALEAVAGALRDRTPPNEIIKIARRAAEATASANYALPLPPAGHASDESFRGIYDVVANDRSELGRSTLAALTSVEMRRNFSAKSFIAMPGFRGKYGFDGSIGVWTRRILTLLFATTLIGFFGWNPIFHLPPFLLRAIPIISVLIIGALFIRVLWIFLITPIIASKAEFLIKDGQIIINSGWFSTSQFVAEVHWIRELAWSQSFLQKVLGEATIAIFFDTPVVVLKQKPAQFRFPTPGVGGQIEERLSKTAARKLLCSLFHRLSPVSAKK